MTFLRRINSFENHQLLKAASYKVWYNKISHYSSKLKFPVETNNLLRDGDAFRERSDRIVRKLRRHCRRRPDHPERQEVFKAVTNFMLKLSEAISQSNSIFEFTPILVGSANEGTRPFLPNEFDYLLVLPKLKEHLVIEYDKFTATTCDVCINSSFQYSDYGVDSCVAGRRFDLCELKQLMDEHIKKVIYDLFHQPNRRFDKTKLFRDLAFIEDKFITTLHLRWYGDHYKDMPISIDLVPCVEFDNYVPHRQVTDTPCKYYVFCKRKREAKEHFFPIAYTDQEQTIMQEITANTRAGLKLAKSLRLVRLMTYESVQQLTACDKNLHEVLKTYMLKSCLFVLHQRLPDPTVELLPEQWALMIYEQLIEFARAGELPMLFDVTESKTLTALINCSHLLANVLEHDEMREACCDQRRDVLVVAQHLHNVLASYCQSRAAALKDVELAPYDHNSHFVD